MGLANLQRILQLIQQRPGWEKLKRYQEVQAAWTKAIAESLQSQTRPLGIRQHVLTIAVSSATLAQTLQLQRPKLLATLNEYLDPPLKDLRFSPLLWHQHLVQSPEYRASIPSPHPKPVPPVPLNSPTAKTTSEALTQWIQSLEQRSSVLQECPQCHSPSLPSELERWSTCAACARQRWIQILSQNKTAGVQSEPHEADEKDFSI